MSKILHNKEVLLIQTNINRHYPGKEWIKDKKTKIRKVVNFCKHIFMHDLSNLKGDRYLEYLVSSIPVAALRI